MVVLNRINASLRRQHLQNMFVQTEQTIVSKALVAGIDPEEVAHTPEMAVSPRPINPDWPPYLQDAVKHRNKVLKMAQAREEEMGPLEFRSLTAAEKQNAVEVALVLLEEQVFIAYASTALSPQLPALEDLPIDFETENPQLEELNLSMQRLRKGTEYANNMGGPPA